MPIKPILKSSSIMIVGEAPGKDEELLGIPFVGTSGDELKKMLREAGIDYSLCAISNVFLTRPADNKIENFCVKKAEAGYNFPPPLSAGKYFKPELLYNRERLYEEIKLCSPNIIIALGNTACWCLLDKTGISSLRGATFTSPYTDAKIFPTYHPAAVLRNWELRHTVVVDFLKAKRESKFKEIKYDEVKVIIEPTPAEMQDYYNMAKTFPAITVDIETSPSRKQITCVGFSNGTVSIVIPFVDKRKEGYSYYPTVSEEVLAWGFIKAMLELPNCKILQNGMYDITWLWRLMGLSLKGNIDDTMLFHHSLFPEMSKGLDFLGSIYANLPAWKTLHRRGEYNKRED